MTRHSANRFFAGMTSIVFMVLTTVASSAQPDSARKSQMNLGSPLFLPAVTYNSGGLDYAVLRDPGWTLVKDLNGDGNLDIVVANWCATTQSQCPGGNVGVLLGNGDGSFRPVATYSSGDYYAMSLIVEDVNGDGIPDLLVGNGCLVQSSCLDSRTSSVGVLLGNGDGTFQPVRNYSSGGELSSMAVADVNGDGNADLVVTNLIWDGELEEGSVGILLGNGDGSFKPVQTYPSGGISPNFVAMADLNADGRVDLLVSNSESCNNCQGNIAVFLGHGDGTFDPGVPCAAYAGVNTILVGDLNSDGKLDIVANEGGSFDGGAIGVALGNGDGTFEPMVQYGAGDYNSSLIMMDLNGDHRPDLAVVDAYGVGVLLGNGDGTFQSVVQYALSGIGGTQVTAGDIDGDGKTDLVAVVQSCGNKARCAYTGLVEVLLGNGDGTFKPSTAYNSEAIYPTWVGLADLNRDGLLDVVAVNGYQKVDGTVSVLLGNPNVLPTTTTSLTSSPNPSQFGQSVTFTAVVTSSGGTPDGRVVFYNASTPLGSVTLSTGKASLSVSSLKHGTRTITAAYKGSSSFAPSTSAPLKQVVIKSDQFMTKTDLSTSGSPSHLGQPVTFTATVTSKNGAIPDGESVTFYDGSVEMGTGATSAGVATIATSSLTAKKHTIKANYPGDATFKASKRSVTQIVQP